MPRALPGGRHPARRAQEPVPQSPWQGGPWSPREPAAPPGPPCARVVPARPLTPAERGTPERPRPRCRRAPCSQLPRRSGVQPPRCDTSVRRGAGVPRTRASPAIVARSSQSCPASASTASGPLRVRTVSSCRTRPSPSEAVPSASHPTIPGQPHPRSRVPSAPSTSGPPGLPTSVVPAEGRAPDAEEPVSSGASTSTARVLRVSLHMPGTAARHRLATSRRAARDAENSARRQGGRGRQQ